MLQRTTLPLLFFGTEFVQKMTVVLPLITCKSAGLDLNTTYEAFKTSSGNSFVHETEGQVILNGSRDINFTMDLVLKDIGLFDEIAKKNKIPLEISPLINQIFNFVRRYLCTTSQNTF